MEEKQITVREIEKQIIKYGRVRGAKIRKPLVLVHRPLQNRTAYVVSPDYDDLYSKADIFFTPEAAVSNAIRYATHRLTDKEGVPIVQRNIYDDPLHKKVTRVTIIVEEDIYNTKHSSYIKVAKPTYGYYSKLKKHESKSED